MKIIFKRSFILFTLIFFLILSLSFVNASNDINKINDINDINYPSETTVVDIENEKNIDFNDSYLLNNENELVLENSNSFLSQKLQSDSISNFKDIQTFIDNAKENETIYLSGTYRGNSMITVNKTINLKSKSGAVLDGKFLTQIMLITAPNVKLENLRFINSNYTGVGVYSDYVTIENCNFENCINGELGSALVCHGNGLNVSNSNFKNNVANKSSCHHTDGAAIYLIGNNCKITNCNFENNWGYNYETASSGGAIWLKGNNINIINSHFINNSAQSKFAWTLHGEEETYLADGLGGAVFIVGANVNIINSIFIDSLSHAQGGALYYKSSSNCSIINSSFINSTSVGEGGVIYLGQNVNGINIMSSSFINNTANGLNGVLVKYTDEGSVIYATKFVDDVKITNSTFLNNKGTSSVYYLGSNLNISDSIIENKNLSTAIIYKNGSLNDNFWDSNFESADEFNKSALIIKDGESQVPDSWFNLEIDGLDTLNSKGEYEYDLSFVLNNASSKNLVNSDNSLPDYKINLNNTANNVLSSNELVLKDNNAKFTYDYIESAKDTVSVYDDFGNLILSKDILSGQIQVNDTGNDTKDLQDAINNADQGSLILLSNKTYVLDTIIINKDIIISGDEKTGIKLSNASDYIFKVSKTDSPNANYSDYFISISNINFILDNGDNVVLAEAANGSSPLSIDVPSINILKNTFTSVDDDVVTKSITVLELDSDRAILAPTRTINISNNSLEIGMDPFDFNVKSILNDSDVKIDVGGNLPIKKISNIVCEDMVTKAIASFADSRSGEYFNVSLKDAHGNVLVNKHVQIGFNGAIYNRTTNESGQVRLQINLAQKGIYTFAVSYLGDEEYKGSFVVVKITVNPQNPIFKANDAKYKVSSKTKTISASFKSMKGSPIAGKKISFTLNGKTYTAKTNSKGLASVKVSLNKKGTYKFTANFAGDNTFAAVTKYAKLVIS